MNVYYIPIYIYTHEFVFEIIHSCSCICTLICEVYTDVKYFLLQYYTKCISLLEIRVSDIEENLTLE